MVFQEATPPEIAEIHSTAYYDVTLGRGGPSEQYVATNGKYLTAFERVLLPVGDSGLGPQEKNQEPKVPIIRVVNHMKVSNTTWPVDTPDVSSDYGWRTPPCDDCSADHKGVDFVPGDNTPVYAVTDGLIVDIGRTGGYGNYMVIEHLVTNNEGELEEWETVYAHMKDNSIPDEFIIGSVVRTGEEIGRVGNTGVSTGSHLHFELIINGKHVDPFPLLGTHQILTFDQKDAAKYTYSGEILSQETEIVGYE
jgi:murein DD-endopeptidase MepM/ murein hydrolase activator NlpD